MEKAVYARGAMGREARGVCRGHCRGARGGSALVKEHRHKHKNMDPCQGCGLHRDWLPRQRQGSSLSAAGWLGRLQTARDDDCGWENLSMERRGLWAMVVRNLAMSLFYDITPAGRGRAAPRVGRAVQEGMELVQAEGSAASFPAEPQLWQLSKENPPPEGQVHSGTGPFGSQALPQSRFASQKHSAHH